MARSSPIVLYFLATCLGTGLVAIPPIASVFFTSDVRAQTTQAQKTEAERLLNLCREHLSQNQPEAAIQSCQQAVAAHQQIKDRAGEAKSTVNLGIAYVRASKYEQAIGILQSALELARTTGERRVEALALNFLGLAYHNLGKSQEAKILLQQSLAIAKEIKDSQLEAGIQQFLSSLEQPPQSPQKAEADRLLQQGLQQAHTSQYREALQSWEASLKIYREIGDREGEASSLNNLGIAYQSLGQYPKAIEFYQQSLAIFKEIGDREAEGINLSNLGVSYEAQNQPELAIVLYKQSVIVREGIRQDLRALSRELQQSYTETVAGTYRRLADLLLSQDRIFEAQQVLELLKLQELQDFTRSQRARGELPKIVLLPKEQEIIDSYGKLVAFAQNIEKCEQTNCPQLAELRNQRDNLKRQYNQDVKQLETAIRQRTAQDDQFLLPTAFNQTADRVIQASDQYNSEPGTAVIYPLILQDKLWLLWATEGKVIGKREITNVGREQLNKEVLKLRFLLQDPNSDLAELQKTAEQLYDWLIQPIEAELEAGNIHHLVFSLDRATRYIPMAVLFDGKQYLIQKYTVTTIIAAQFTDTSDRLPANVDDTPILGVGSSKAPGYRPLPYITSEIDSIVRDNTSNASQGIYPGKKLLDAAFTQQNLRDNLTGRKLLHIATHGEFVPGNQDDSYLVLGDGEKLRIPDIQILDDYLDGVHLVVLSACETALGDSLLTDPKQEEGIEINALSFYFLSGGAKTVMASLWRVDDPSTSLLMQRFYCILANSQSSLTKAEALRTAQLSLLEGTQMPNCPSLSGGDRDFSHPHYWAPFILIGNGL